VCRKHKVLLVNEQTQKWTIITGGEFGARRTLMLFVLPHWRRCWAGGWQSSSVTSGHQHHLGPRNLCPEQRHECESLLQV